MDLSQKSYLEAWNPSVFIKFVTSDSFFNVKFNQIFVILKPKSHYFSWIMAACSSFNQSDDDFTFEDDEG